MVEQRLKALALQDSSSTNLHSLTALEQREKLALKQLIALKAEAEQDGQKSGLNAQSHGSTKSAMLKKGIRIARAMF